MSKIQDFAVYVTTAQKATFTSLDGNSRLNVVKNFYKENSLEIPVSVTVSTSKKGSYLTKDEKINIQAKYIKALQSGNVTPELENNFKAVTGPETVATFSETLPYNEAVSVFGPAVPLGDPDGFVLFLDGMPDVTGKVCRFLQEFPPRRNGRRALDTLLSRNWKKSTRPQPLRNKFRPYILQRDCNFLQSFCFGLHGCLSWSDSTTTHK